MGSREGLQQCLVIFPNLAVPYFIFFPNLSTQTCQCLGYYNHFCQQILQVLCDHFSSISNRLSMYSAMECSIFSCQDLEKMNYMMPLDHPICTVQSLLSSQRLFWTIKIYFADLGDDFCTVHINKVWGQILKLMPCLQKIRSRKDLCQVNFLTKFEIFKA